MGFLSEWRRRQGTEWPPLAAPEQRTAPAQRARPTRFVRYL